MINLDNITNENLLSEPKYEFLIKSEPKYEFFIKKCEDVGTNYFNDPNAFIECSNMIDDVYENIEDYNPNRKKINCVWWRDCRHYDKQKISSHNQRIIY